jgi:hypothetical protein
MYTVRSSGSAERAQELRTTVAGLRPAQREEAILRAVQTAIRGVGAPVGKFTYRSKTGSRRTHHGHASKICDPDIAPVEATWLGPDPTGYVPTISPLLLELRNVATSRCVVCHPDIGSVEGDAKWARSRSESPEHSAIACP